MGTEENFQENLQGNSLENLPLLLYLLKKVGKESLKNSEKVRKNGLKNSKNSETKVLTTVEIAHDMNFSQQTASRKIAELEEQGLIIKEYSPDGLKIRLTEKAETILKENYESLKSIFEKNQKKQRDKTLKTLNGVVTSGIGEGKYYVQIEQYNKAFEKLLGKTPFSGTLNIVGDNEQYKRFLLGKEMIKIDGFKTNTRTFGWINTYKVKLRKETQSKFGRKLSKFNKFVDAIIVIPERTIHRENIIEIVSAVYLRGELKLSDYDKVEII